jgi:hypothetical protein
MSRPLSAPAIRCGLLMQCGPLIQGSGLYSSGPPILCAHSYSVGRLYSVYPAYTLFPRLHSVAACTVWRPVLCSRLYCVAAYTVWPACVTRLYGMAAYTGVARYTV